jgi:hypothetical protein
MTGALPDDRDLVKPSQEQVHLLALDLYATAPMPDKRLNKRAVAVFSALAQNPTDSIPQAMGNWADTKGAYRFLENKRIKPHHIHNAHRSKTARDAKGLDSVLVIQDSTSLSFPKALATEGLGPITSKTTPGLMVHSALVATRDGGVIGLAWQQVWAREGKHTESKSHRRALPIEEKESFKWLLAVRETHRTLDEISDSQPPRQIHVCDREADIHEFFEETQTHGDGAVVRSSQNRCATDENGEMGRAWEHLAQMPVQGVIEVELPKRLNRSARTAKLELRSVTVKLQPASSCQPGRQPLTANLVEAREIEFGADVSEPLLWRLVTTEPVATFEAVREVVRIYTKRWLIEEMHLVLKSGCKMEELRLRTAERIEILLAFYCPVAVLLMQLRHLSRTEPETPCTRVIDNTTWRVLYAAIHRERAPAQMPPPTIRQAVLWIGRLGGHLGRKGDGMPGLRTLWRGWRDLSNCVSIARPLGLC